MKKSIILMVPLLLLFSPASPVHARTGADPAALLVKANEAYLQGDYAAAEILYRYILDQGVRNGRVYYNLGNTLFRRGKTGEAIQRYLQARRFMPRNEDLEANLGYARRKVEDKIEASGAGVLRDIVFWYDRLTLKEMFLAFLAINVLFWLCLGLRLFVRVPAVNRLVLVFLAAGLVMGGTAAARLVTESRERPAVIIAQEAPVRSGMDPESATLFILHDGAEVRAEKESGDWILISAGTGKKGWVRKEQVGLVDPGA